MPRKQHPSGIHDFMEPAHQHVALAATVLLLAACSDGANIDAPSGNVDGATGTPQTSAGTTTGVVGTTTGAVGTTTGVMGTTTGAVGTTGGVDVGTTGGVGGATGVGGASATTSVAMGGASATTMGAGGTLGGFGGDGTIGEYELDCGPEGEVIESAGPPQNRVNFVIVGEGYDASEIETTFLEHVNGVMDRRFNHESGEPFARYRRFINICAMKSAGTGNVGSPFNGGISGRVSSINEK
jgi:hypothetical protein